MINGFASHAGCDPRTPAEDAALQLCPGKAADEPLCLRPTRTQRFSVPPTSENPTVEIGNLPERLCRIGPFLLRPPAIQAGLAGYSDLAMRVVARRRGCPYAVTEALLDRVLLAGGRGREKGAVLSAEDHPVAGQIMGSEAPEMAQAAKILRQAGFDVIDLNFACPVRKVLGRCRGGYLLSHPNQAVEIMNRVRDVTPGPLTLKLRRALDGSSQAAEWFDIVSAHAVRLEFAALAVHARTVVQKYTGRADWNFLRQFKRRYPGLTIFGSGDIYTAQDALRMYRQTGVDGIWIARGAIGNPWIFRQLAALLAGGPPPAPPRIHEQQDALREHFDLALRLYPQEQAARHMRKMGIKYARWHPRSAQVWQEFIAVRSRADWENVLGKHYVVDGPGREAPDAAGAGEPYSEGAGGGEDAFCRDPDAGRI